jgi:hypothetical protein
MMLATISILAGAIARPPFAIMKAGPPAFFDLTDVFVVACVLYDLVTSEHIHRTTALVGVLPIGLPLVLGGTSA